MGLRKKKKIEEVKEEVVEEIPVEEEVAEEVITGEIEVAEEPVEEIKEEEPVSSDIRIGSKVSLIRPIDYDGRPLDIDIKAVYKVYAIDGDKVQLRTARGNIFFVKLANLKKID